MIPERLTIIFLLAITCIQLTVGLLIYYTQDDAGSFFLSGIITSIVVIIFIMYMNSNDRTQETNSISNEILFHSIAFTMAVFLLVFNIVSSLKFSCETCTPGEKNVTVNNYFETLRDDEAALTAFFSQMPKGGDLHNHYSGAIYAESYLEQAIARKLWVNPQTLKIESDPLKITREFLRIDTLSMKSSFPDLKQRLLRDWSVKDYFEGLGPSDKHFFDAFTKFPKGGGWTETRKGMIELKQRAKVENTLYIELMIGSIPYTINKKIYSEKYEKLNVILRNAEKLKNSDSLIKIFNFLYDEFKKNSADSSRIFIDSLQIAHHLIDDELFSMRYLISVKRESEPIDVFKNLTSAFFATTQSDLIVGVNIVAPEDGNVAMRDYRLHMQMFRFLHEKFPSVKYSLHAGELTLGLIKPEDLSWHIRDAIYTAGANRIGHGVDIPYETDCKKIMQYMGQHKIAVEINLESNEFILRVKDDLHPLMLYIKNKVPVVISTDDAGILRTNHTRQFVLLAKRYKQLNYSDIKKIIENSIKYSFIKESKLRDALEENLQSRFKIFEKKVLEEISD